MGLFGRKKPEDNPQEAAMRQAENIAAGKGLTGKLVKGFIGSDNATKIGAAMETARQAQGAASLQAQGLPTVNATVVSLTDTGKLINFDPVVDLVASLDSGE